MSKRKKVKPLSAAEAVLTERLIAEGWEESWISQRILDTVLRDEKKVRSEIEKD